MVFKIGDKMIYNEIKDLLMNYELNKTNKGINRSKLDLTTYYKVGSLLTKAILRDGEDIIKDYSNQLKLDVNKKYTELNLRKYRYFYLLIENGGRLSFDLKWSHYIELLHFNIKKSNYYIYLIEHNNLSIRELRSRIKSNEYEKFNRGTYNNLKGGIKINGDTGLKDFVKNPLIIKNSLNKVLPDDELHNLILDDIKILTNKLNTNYSVIGVEYQIKFNSNIYMIDLLLFSVKFNCYIVVELKLGSFSSDYIFQLENYMDYIDDNIKLISENKTIGVILVRKNNDYIAYCTDNRILVRDDNLIK